MPGGPNHLKEVKEEGDLQKVAREGEEVQGHQNHLQQGMEMAMENLQKERAREKVRGKARAKAKGSQNQPPPLHQQLCQDPATVILMKSSKLSRSEKLVSTNVQGFGVGRS